MKIRYYDQPAFPFRALLSGVLGLALLMPAGLFMLTLLARVGLGSRKLYYYFAPSFLQSPFDLFAWHKAQFILCSLLVAIVANGLALLQFRIDRTGGRYDIAVSYRRNWLNTAIVLQGILFLLILGAYTLIQHVRY